MCNCPIFTCPEEIVVIIVSHIEERYDLLNLALTSKRFRRIIIPSFLDLFTSGATLTESTYGNGLLLNPSSPRELGHLN